ncbi:hypothetical protein [Kitasatospora phosalacinea]|uniref:Uncharacterized protein n=1 Tax=Kitasatospora phosalacinea TaxID=2065 RepID=A0ABW6GMC2_9ACTN
MPGQARGRAEPGRITLHLLPASRARNADQLADEVRRFLYRRQKQPHIVRGYFQGSHVRYITERLEI